MTGPAHKTIGDFGTKWTRYPHYEGYLGSHELLQDTLEPLLSVADIKGARAAEIGSGAGRFATMLLGADVRHLLAVEPSAAYTVLNKNTERFGERIECLNVDGTGIPAGLELDYVFSVGVLHHIPEPESVVRAAWHALRPGGRMLIWLYGHEGNETYIRLVEPIRAISHRLPPVLLAGLSHLLTAFLSVYAVLCRAFPLPMRRLYSTWLRNCHGGTGCSPYTTNLIPCTRSITQRTRPGGCSKRRVFTMLPCTIATTTAGRSSARNNYPPLRFLHQALARSVDWELESRTDSPLLQRGII